MRRKYTAALERSMSEERELGTPSSSGSDFGREVDTSAAAGLLIDVIDEFMRSGRQSAMAVAAAKGPTATVADGEGGKNRRRQQQWWVVRDGGGETGRQPPADGKVRAKRSEWPTQRARQVAGDTRKEGRESTAKHRRSRQRRGHSTGHTMNGRSWTSD